ncbi:MAG: hypothetical protein JEZ11_14340 [Desulfobacterales bacterium]|nr:hypothetical protein [Desulfobacterales bacterium]
MHEIDSLWTFLNHEWVEPLILRAQKGASLILMFGNHMKGGTMVDKQRLLEQLRKLKKQIQSDSRVKALYDTDGDGNISGEEWDKARQSVIAFMGATESEKPSSGSKNSKAAGAAGLAIAGAAGAADAVFGQIKERVGQSGYAADGTLWTEPAVIVEQEVSGTEMLSSNDVPNRYKFFSEKGKKLASAIEIRSSGFRRTSLGGRPPFKMDITVHGTSEVLRLDRHYEFNHLQTDVSCNDTPIGLILEKGTSKGNHYVLSPNAENRDLTISKSMLSRTFAIKSGSKQVGSIEKKWGGILKEAFTQADSFRIAFDDPSLTPTEKKLIAAATIIIDMDYFGDEGSHLNF